MKTITFFSVLQYKAASPSTVAVTTVDQRVTDGE